MDVKDLINRLERAKAKDPKRTNDIELEILWNQYEKDKVREVVTNWALEQTEYKDEAEQAKRIAELEAKVYAYEKIIANSNFQPLIATTPPPQTLPLPEPPRIIYTTDPFFKPPYEVTCENRTDEPYKIFDGEKLYTCENGKLTPCEPICEEGATDE